MYLNLARSNGPKSYKLLKLQLAGADSNGLSTCLGSKSISATPPDPIDKHTDFSLASITKLPATIAALQLVEQDCIQFDDDVAEKGPTWAVGDFYSVKNMTGDSEVKCSRKVAQMLCIAMVRDRCTIIVFRQRIN